jgi:hypothetical protein
VSGLLPLFGTYVRIPGSFDDVGMFSTYAFTWYIHIFDVGLSSKINDFFAKTVGCKNVQVTIVQSDLLPPFVQR